MPLSIAHLGPTGTYTEQAALAYLNLHAQGQPIASTLCPCPNIARSIQSTATGTTQLTVAPVENAIEGSVTITLDSLWQLDNLEVRQALILPIVHVLATHAPTLDQLQTVYSHPQALGQCQRWLENHVPKATLKTTNSTTEAVQLGCEDPNVAAIASERAAQLYQLPILHHGIQDHPRNCTRFWILGQKNDQSLPKLTLNTQSYTSLAFSLPANQPGALLRALEIFAQRKINLSRIESRPSKRSMGDYVFFLDAEVSLLSDLFQDTLSQLQTYTEVLKIFGSYSLITIGSNQEIN